MANRNLAPSKGDLYRGVITLEGRADLTASSGVVATTSVGLAGDQSIATAGFARTNTGLYTWTLADKYLGPVFATVALEKATAENLVVELVSIDVSSVSNTPIITFRTALGSTGAAADCTNACKVHVIVRAVDSAN